MKEATEIIQDRALEAEVSGAVPSTRKKYLGCQFHQMFLRGKHEPPLPTSAEAGRSESQYKETGGHQR